MTALFNPRASVDNVARPRTYDADLRAALVAAAAAQIAAGGPTGLSLRALAAQVGTSTNAIYAMFGGKPELIGAVLEAADESFTRAQRQALGAGTTLADLRRLRHDYRDWALAHPTLFSAMFGDQQLLGAAVPLERDIAEGTNGGREASIAFWHEWMGHETAFLAEDQPWTRASVVVNGTPTIALGADEVAVAP